jgi:hypothetical protein
MAHPTTSGGSCRDARRRATDRATEETLHRQVDAGQAFRQRVEAYGQALRAMAPHGPAPGCGRSPWNRQEWAAKRPEAAKRPSKAAVIQDIEALIARAPLNRLDFGAVEVAARRRVLAVAARAVDRPLNANHADHAGAQWPCAGCRGPARYAGSRDKRVTRWGRTICPWPASTTGARRPGKPRGCGEAREVKLGEGHDAESTPTLDAGSVTYSAAIERAARKHRRTLGAFAAWVEREHHKCSAPAPGGTGAHSRLRHGATGRSR